MDLPKVFQCGSTCSLTAVHTVGKQFIDVHVYGCLLVRRRGGYTAEDGVLKSSIFLEEEGKSESSNQSTRYKQTASCHVQTLGYVRWSRMFLSLTKVDVNILIQCTKKIKSICRNLKILADRY